MGGLGFRDNRECGHNLTVSTTVENAAIQGITVSIDDRAVHVASREPLKTLSSAVIGAELQTARHVLNMHVHKNYASENPEQDIIGFAKSLGIDGPLVGMMTAAYTHKARVAVEANDGLTVAVIATGGLSNVTSAGLSAPANWQLGTINMILLVDASLTPAAMVNLVMTATEAKTLTLLEMGVRTEDGDPASGTSTDAMVVACTGRGADLRYAGPATIVGWLAARATRRALSEALR